MTGTTRVAMQAALEATSQFVEKHLTVGQRYTNEGQALLDAITGLRAELEKQQVEPLTECHDNDSPWLVCKPCAADGKCKQAQAQAPQQAEPVLVPAGWQLAPVEPTWEMTRAGIPPLNKPEPRVADIDAAYRAMLKAAPVPPSRPQQAEPTISVQEAWEAAGGNPGLKATREELLDALRIMDEAVDEVDAQASLSEKVLEWLKKLAGTDHAWPYLALRAAALDVMAEYDAWKAREGIDDDRGAFVGLRAALGKP